MVLALRFFAILSFLLLLVSTGMGLVVEFGRPLPTGHIAVALFTTFLLCLAQVFVMFYFIGTGSQIKEVVKEKKLDVDLWRKTVEYKNRLFGWISLAILLVMATFILGGGVDTGVLPRWVHGVLALASVLVNGVTLRKELVALAENEALIGRVSDILARGR
jgi:hypothetical protein